MKLITKAIPNLKNLQPKADIAYCQECGWEGSPNDCLKGEEGDWESGYYEIDFCPICEDGGAIDYTMTEQRAKAWEQWFKDKYPTKKA